MDAKDIKGRQVDVRKQKWKQSAPTGRTQYQTNVVVVRHAALGYKSKRNLKRTTSQPISGIIQGQARQEQGMHYGHEPATYFEYSKVKDS